MVKRRLGLIVSVFLMAFTAVAVITFQMKPVYTAAATVLIQAREQGQLDIGSIMAGLPPDSAAVDTEVQVIQSNGLLEKVVRKLDLTTNPEFNPFLAEPSRIQRTIGEVRAFITGLTGESEAAAEAAPDEEAAAARERLELDLVIQSLRERISVTRVETTFIIAIAANSGDPDMASELANTVAELYLVEQLDAKFEATRRQNEWLDERLADLRDEVNTAESMVEAYRAASGLLSAQGSTLTEQQVSDLTAQRVILEGELAERRARLQSVRTQLASGDSAEGIAEALASPVIGALRQQQAEVRRRRADMESRYGPRYPELERVKSEEADLTRQIDAEVRRIVANLESEVVIAREKVATLNGSLSSIRGEMASNNRALVQLRELERNAEASRTLYEAFLARFKQTNEQDGIQQADARIVSRASPPTGPSFPKTSLNLALGIIVGLVLAAVVALITEALDNYISSGSEVERLFHVPFIGQVPLITGGPGFGKQKLHPGEHLIEKPHSGFAEAFRNIRASIVFADLDKAARTVAVVSSLPDEGKTTISYCLGRMSAMSGTKTIVIDGDFRRRQLTEIAGLEPERGLLEYLFGETSLSDAVSVDAQTGLHILPLTDRKHTPRDVFGSRAFDALLTTLKQTYDLIVIDTGPILLMAETRVVASKVDQVLVAARWRKTNRASLHETLALLKDFKANLTGIVLTMVDLRRRRQHSYSAANYKAYNKYYTAD
ncbi:AAA family ATPase [bacterium]|nr:AAA family ATPase [bacterium]